MFTTLALVNILIRPLNAFPWVLNGLVEAGVSLKRLQSFLDVPEIDWNKIYTTELCPLGTVTNIRLTNIVEC